jgi:hypothetical protein
MAHDSRQCKREERNKTTRKRDSAGVRFFGQTKCRGGRESFRTRCEPMSRVFYQPQIESAGNLISPGKYFEKSISAGLGVDGPGRHNAAPLTAGRHACADRLLAVPKKIVAMRIA